MNRRRCRKAPQPYRYYGFSAYKSRDSGVGSISSVPPYNFFSAHQAVLYLTSSNTHACQSISQIQDVTTPCHQGVMAACHEEIQSRCFLSGDFHDSTSCVFFLVCLLSSQNPTLLSPPRSSGYAGDPRQQKLRS